MEMASQTARSWETLIARYAFTEAQPGPPLMGHQCRTAILILSNIHCVTHRSEMLSTISDASSPATVARLSPAVEPDFAQQNALNSAGMANPAYYVPTVSLQVLDVLATLCSAAAL